MAIVYLPSAWQPHTGGLERITIEAPRVRELLEALASRFPTLADDFARSSVAIDGQIYHHATYEPLRADSEVHFVPRIAGGAHLPLR